MSALTSSNMLFRRTLGLLSTCSLLDVQAVYLELATGSIRLFDSAAAAAVVVVCSEAMI